MKFSVGSWSFHATFERGDMDVFGYLESMRYRYNLNTADIWNGMITSLDDQYIERIRRALKDRELTLVNLAVDGADLWHDDETVREKQHQYALAHLRMADILGAKTVRIDMGPNSTDMSNEQFDFIVNRYREYAEIGYNCGFQVGPQNHKGPAMVPATNMAVYQAVNHPGYSVLLDLERWVTDSDLGDEMFAGIAMHVHFHTPTILNRLNEKTALLKQHNYKGYLSVEYRLGGDEYGEVAWELETLKRAWKRTCLNHEAPVAE